MANPISIVVYPVKDIAKAKTVYSTFLGVEPYADSPYYVGYKIGDLEIGLAPSNQTIISYTDTEDIQASLKEMTEAGCTVSSEPKNVGGGLMVATVKDEDGNELGFRQQPK